MVWYDEDPMRTFVAVFEHRFGIDTALFQSRALSFNTSEVAKLFGSEYEGHTEECEFGDIREVCDFEDHRADEFINFDLIDITNLPTIGENLEQTS